MNIYDYLSPSGADILNNIDEEIRAEVEFALFDAANKLELKNNSLDIVNLGNRVRPDLWLNAEGTDIGTLSVSSDSNITVNLDENAFAKVRVAEEVKEALFEALDNEEPWINEITSDNKNDAMSLIESKPEDMMTRTKVAKETIDKINQSLAGKGLDNPLEKQQKKLLSEMEKADKKDIKNLDAKTQYKDTVGELSSLYSQLKEQLEIAKENGFSEKESVKIQDIAEKIAQKSVDAAALKSQIPTFKDRVMKTVSDKSAEVKNSVTASINKIKAGIDAKIQAGRNALGMIKNEVSAANDRFYARTDTLYTGLTEKVEQVSRDWKALTYTVDKNICNSMEQLKGTLEKSYDRQAEIKGAFKDLGRAIVGKERTGERTDYTEVQKACLTFLTSSSQKLQNEMHSIKMEYDVSLAASIHNVKSAQEHRSSSGLDFSKSLDDNIKNAIARSQKVKEEKTSGKEVQEKSSNDITR